jgi:glucokinase
VSYLIGIDLGGSSVKAVAVTEEGTLLAKRNLPFDSSDPMSFASRIQEVLVEFRAAHGESFESIGLSAPGLASPEEDSISFMPGRLQGLEDLNWTEFLKSEKSVLVLNDAHAALVGESWVGAGKGMQNVIMITLGTGVGGAAIVNGNLLRGQIGRAGHLGHVSLDIEGQRDVCGTPGSLEVLIGNCTIEQRSQGRFKTTHELVQRYEQGDSQAKTIWLKSVKALACAINSYINILDPEAVIVGGGIARSGASLFEPLEEFLRQIEWQPGGHQARLLSAELGELAGAFGAAVYGRKVRGD